MAESPRRHVLLTGASAGLGAAMAREWSRAGAAVTLVARREALLEALAAELPGPSFVLARDLSDPSTAPDLIVPAESALGPVDVLINNAGMQIVGATATTDPAAADRLLRLDLHMPLALTAAVLPGMLARRTGTIVDIASMAALAPTPGMTWYNAAKAGLAAASEAMRAELAGTGVHVLTVYPGIIPTDMGTAGLAAYESSWALRLQPQGTPEGLAVRIRSAVERGRPRVIYPAFNATARWFPTVTRWIMDRFSPPLVDKS